MRSVAWLAASAASGASAATPARKPPLFNFDPSSTLGWSVPLILFAPFVLFALMVFSVRYRRSASNVALFGFLVGLAVSLLVSWAQFGKARPYTATFPYLSLSLTFTGANRFQNFQLDLGFRLDHLALAALVTVMAVGLACVIWHRAGGRDEQGPVRFQAAMLLLAFAAAGVIVSPDLTELLAFWGIAGVASYLLAAHRWGSAAGGPGGQVALWLPLAGDLCLLLGLGLLWSRYGGPLTVQRLVPLLHSTPGAGLKSLTTACLLILAAVVVRAGVAPFHAWCVGSRESPAAGLAFMQAVWPILAGLLLYRSLPLFLGAGPQALRTAAYALTVAAGLGLVLALVGNDVRRAASLAGSAGVALLLFAAWQPAGGVGRAQALTGAAALGGLLVAGPARAALLLALSSLSGQIRSFGLGDLGAGWARMPYSTLALLLGSVSLALAPVLSAVLVASGRRQLVLGVGLGALALVTWRVYVVAAHGPLRPRRAFDPARVREAPMSMAVGALLSGLLGLVGLALLLVPLAAGPGAARRAAPPLLTRWLDFLEGAPHAAPSVQTLVLWLAPSLAGAALATLGWSLLAAPLLDLSAWLAGWFWRGWSVLLRVLRRFIGLPGPGLVERVGVDGIGEAEAGIGTALGRLGRLSDGGLGGGRLPALPLVVALVVLGAVVVALLSPGVSR